MSLTQLTHYPFSNEHGVTGTLAADPIFNTAKNGDEYARFAIYCKASNKSGNGEKKTKRRRRLSDADHLPLIAYVSIFDKDLLSDVEHLQKGYFVTFYYNTITFSLGVDEETHRVRTNALLVANAFKIRHIPEKATAKKSRRDSDSNDDEARDEKPRHHRKT